MPARPCPVPPSTRALGPDDLDHLVTVLVEASVGASPAVVRARRGPRLVDLGLARVPDGLDPVDALVGLAVPRGWEASGLVTPVVATLPDGSRVRGVSAVVVGRDGHVASHLGGDDAMPAVDEAPEGTVVDLLRRSLGLPTPAPTTSPATFWTTLWLDGVVAEAVQRDRHPDVAAPDGADEVGPDHAAPDDARRPVAGPPVTAELVDALGAVPGLEHPAGWGALRRLATDDLDDPAMPPAAARVVRRALAALVSPGEAAWHDDGSFARWLERAVPPVPDLLAIADAACDGHLARQLRAVTGTPPGAGRAAPTVPERRGGHR